jgi:hypothetical protein
VAQDAPIAGPGITKQVEIVRAAFTNSEFATVPITGMLCFVEADGRCWRLVHDIRYRRTVAFKFTVKIIARGGLSSNSAVALHRHLATRFPPA